MAVDQLSTESINALRVSQDLGKELGMTRLSKELILTGFLTHPERAKRTLEKYGIQAKEVRRASIQTIESKTCHPTGYCKSTKL